MTDLEIEIQNHLEKIKDISNEELLSILKELDERDQINDGAVLSYLESAAVDLYKIRFNISFWESEHYTYRK